MSETESVEIAIIIGIGIDFEQDKEQAQVTDQGAGISHDRFKFALKNLNIAFAILLASNAFGLQHCLILQIK